MSLEDDLNHEWTTCGGAVWRTSSAFTDISVDRLPQLPLLDENLDWLESFQPRHPKRTFFGLGGVLPARWISTLASTEGTISHLPCLIQQAASLGFSLPPSFLKFLGSPDLQSRIATGTHCYLDLSESLVPIPGYSGCYALRFLNDSQVSVLWYLLFQPSRPVRVLVSGFFLEPDIFDVLNEDDDPLPYDDVMRCTAICADSFPEFLYRFWIEEWIWYNLRDGIALSTAQSEYVNNAKL